MQVENKIRELEAEIRTFISSRVKQMMVLFNQYEKQKVGISRQSLCKILVDLYSSYS